MRLYKPAQNLLLQLQEVLALLAPEVYTREGRHLSGATIGQHVRHIIELFAELHNGYGSGVVNYDGRKRDYRLETDIRFAGEMLCTLPGLFHQRDKDLQLVTGITADGPDPCFIKTTYYRELLFNMEHTVHHMALIRVGIQEMTTLVLPASFGVAEATIKHQQSQCAQ